MRWDGSRLVAVAAVAALLGVVFTTLAYPAAPADAPPVRAMTYNVHQWYSEGKTGLHNLEAVRDVIRGSGAEVVGLQESEGARVTSGNLHGVRWLARDLGVHAVYGPPTRDMVYGVSLLSAWPITSWDVVELPADQSIERVAVTATVDAPTGPLHVVVTHLQTESYVGDRVAQSEVVVDLASRHERAVVLGDLNTPPDPGDPAWEVLMGNLTDAWQAAGNPADSGATSPASDPGQRIDHVLLHGAWDVTAADVVGSARASDHRAVWADLTPGS